MAEPRITVGHWILLAFSAGMTVFAAGARLAFVAVLFGGLTLLTGWAIWRSRDRWRGAEPLSGWTMTDRDVAFLPPTHFPTTSERPLRHVQRGRVAGRDVVAWVEPDLAGRHWFFAVPLRQGIVGDLAPDSPAIPDRVRQVMALHTRPLPWRTMGAWLVVQDDDMGPTRFRSWVNKEGIQLARLATALDEAFTPKVDEWVALVPGRHHHEPRAVRPEDTTEPEPTAWPQPTFDIRATVQDPKT